jgi:protein arginine N-methyltransferase 1
MELYNININDKILPDRATMHLSAIEDNSFKRSKSSFWDNVYDINMDCLKPYVLKEPMIDCAEKRMVNSSVSNIYEIDLYTVTKEQLDFSKKYEVTFFRNDTFNGIVVWFDIFFDKLPNKVQFSTG